MELFTRLFFLQDCEKHSIFAASIIDTASRLVLQKADWRELKSDQL